MSRYFPTIEEEDLQPLRLVLSHLAEDPTALDDADCPYSPAVRAFFGKFVVAPAPVVKGELNRADLEGEIESLRSALDEYGGSLKDGDTTEKMQFFKLKASLIEKLVSLKERSVGVREIHEFQEMVLRTIDEVLEPGQRTEVMKRLGSYQS